MRSVDGRSDVKARADLALREAVGGLGKAVDLVAVGSGRNVRETQVLEEGSDKRSDQRGGASKTSLVGVADGTGEGAEGLESGERLEAGRKIGGSEL